MGHFRALTTGAESGAFRTQSPLPNALNRSSDHPTTALATLSTSFLTPPPPSTSAPTPLHDQKSKARPGEPRTVPEDGSGAPWTPRWPRSASSHGLSTLTWAFQNNNRADSRVFNPPKRNGSSRVPPSTQYTLISLLGSIIPPVITLLPAVWYPLVPPASQP